MPEIDRHKKIKEIVLTVFGMKPATSLFNGEVVFFLQDIGVQMGLPLRKQEKTGVMKGSCEKIVCNGLIHRHTTCKLENNSQFS
jgi:hypothetical protein